MPNVTDTYQGELCVNCVHIPSQASVMAETIMDGFGHDDSFAPPDLIASALGACLLMTMGVYANKHTIDITGADADVSYSWTEDGGQLAGMEVTLRMPARSYKDAEKKALENCIQSAPMHKSLSSIPQKINFIWL